MGKVQEKKINKNIILDLLNHSGAAYRAKGIMTCIMEKSKTEEIVRRLKELKRDDTILLGHRIASYAVAALDLLGEEPYTESDPEIKDLIEGLPMMLEQQ